METELCRCGSIKITDIEKVNDEHYHKLCGGFIIAHRAINILKGKKNFLHNHPHKENALRMSKYHVIVDREDWEEARKLLNI